MQKSAGSLRIPHHARPGGRHGVEEEVLGDVAVAAHDAVGPYRESGVYMGARIATGTYPFSVSVFDR